MTDDPVAYLVENPIFGRRVCLSKGLAEERFAEHPHSTTIMPLYASRKSSLTDSEWAAISFCIESDCGGGVVTETLKSLLTRTGDQESTLAVKT